MVTEQTELHQRHHHLQHQHQMHCEPLPGCHYCFSRGSDDNAPSDEHGTVAQNITAVQVGILDDHRLASSLVPPELESYAISQDEWTELAQDLQCAFSSGGKGDESGLQQEPATMSARQLMQQQRNHRRNVWMLERVLPVGLLMGIMSFVSYFVLAYSEAPSEDSGNGKRHHVLSTLDQKILCSFVAALVLLRVYMQFLYRKVSRYRLARAALAKPVLEKHTSRFQSRGPGQPVFLLRQQPMTVMNEVDGKSVRVRVDAMLEILVENDPSDESYRLHEP